MAGIEDMRVVLEGEIGPMEQALQKADAALGKFEGDATKKLAGVDKALGGLGAGKGATALAALHPKALLAKAGIDSLGSALRFAGDKLENGGLTQAAGLVETLSQELSAATGPMEMIAAGVRFASGALETFGDQVSVTEDGVVKLTHVAQAVPAVLGEEFQAIKAAAQASLDGVVAKLHEVGKGMTSLPDAMAFANAELVTVFGHLQKLWEENARMIAASAHVLVVEAGEFLVRLVNMQLQRLEDLVNGAIDLLNRIPGIALDMKIAVPRIPNPLEGAGAKAREEYKAAGVTLGQDIVSGVAEGAGGILERIMKRAREIAEKKDEPGADAADGDDEAEARSEALLAKMRRAAEQVQEAWRRALMAQGDYLSAAEVQHAKELARFQQMHKDKLISEEQYQKARAALEVVKSEEIIKARERMHQREMQLTRRTEALEALKRYTEVVQQEYEREAAKLDEMLARKLISEARYQEARANLAIVASKKLVEAAEREFDRVREVTNVVASAMERAFTSFIETGKLDFKEFARSVIADIARIAFRMAVIEALFGRSGQGFGLTGTLLGLPGRAAGGPVTGGSAYMVGERGPELFVPRVSGSIVPNHALGNAGGGPVSVSMPIVIDARGAYPESIADIRREVQRLEVSIPGKVLTTVVDARARRMLR